MCCLAQGALCGLGDEVLTGIEEPIETAMGQPGFLHELGYGYELVLAAQVSGDGSVSFGSAH